MVEVPRPLIEISVNQESLMMTLVDRNHKWFVELIKGCFLDPFHELASLLLLCSKQISEINGKPSNWLNYKDKAKRTTTYSTRDSQRTARFKLSARLLN